MTVLIRAKGYWALALGAAAVAIGIGVAAHGALAASDSETARLAGERLLFAGVVGAAALFAVALGVHLRSVSVSRTLEKLSEMSRLTGASPEPGLKRLGELGDRISRLYSQQLTVGARKSDKISALSSLTDNLLHIEQRPVGVTDATGKLLYLSPALLEEFDLERADAIGAALDSIIPDLNLTGAARHFDRDRTTVVRELDSGTISIVPIYSRSNELTYCICVFGRIELPRRPHADSTGSAKQKRRKLWRSR